MINLVAEDFLEKFKESLDRIRGDLVQLNISGCLNNCTDLTHISDFVDFDEGVFLGEVLEGIFDNFDDMVSLYVFKKEELEPLKKVLDELLTYLEKTFPPKSEKAKAELYERLVSARCYVTKVQVASMREKTPKRPPNRPPFEPT